MLAGGTDLQQQLTSRQLPDFLDNTHWPGTVASAYMQGLAASAVAQVHSCLVKDCKGCMPLDIHTVLSK